MDDILTQKKSIKEWAEDERPREKAIKNGISTLSKSELLAILVGSGNDEESAVDLMKRVLNSCGNSISELARLSVDDLCTFKGIGPAKAISIMAACELWKRRENDGGTEQRCITSSKDLYRYFLEEKPQLAAEIGKARKFDDGLRASLCSALNEFAERL